MSGKLTDNYNVILADFGINLLTNTYSTYVVAGKPFAWPDDDHPPVEQDTLSEIADTRSNMIVGVKVNAADVKPIVKRNTWTAHTVYDQYDPTLDLETLTFYIINSNADVYKCLFNNNGVESTIEPTAKSTASFTLSDGYIWKYLYSVSEANETKFGTDDYIALTANSTITAAAVPGTIDAYQITESDVGFYTPETGLITDATSTTVFKLQNTANTGANTFGDSALYISDGTGAGAIRKIRSSHANSVGKFVTTANSITLDLTSEYYISPLVTIDGDGTGAQAIAIVANTVVQKVLSVNKGAGYSSANVTIGINPAFGLTATARPLISTINGHGANVNIELVSKKLAISSTIAPDVSTDLPPGTIYRQMDVIMAPWSPAYALCNTAVISFATKLGISSGTFNPSDKIVGATSGAKAVVYSSNTTQLNLIDVSGSFANTEVVSCPSTAASATVTRVTERDADKNSGQVVYYSNLLPINKSNTSPESVRLVIDFQG